MSNRVRNRVLLGGVAAIVALVVALSAGGDSVATVNGRAITYDEVIALLTDEETVAADQFTTQFTRTLLGFVADRAILDQAAAEFGLTRTQAEIEAHVEEITRPFIVGDVTLEDLLASNNLTVAGLDALAAQGVMQEKVISELVADLPAPSEEELRQNYQAALAGQANVCSSHILLESEGEAQAAVDRALAGEDFAALAMELSTGPSGPTGGDLGCGAPSGFVVEFANATLEAEVGVPSGPVRTSFGWHVILVSERTAPTFEELRDELMTGLAEQQGQTLWTSWLVATLESADVVVEPEYGTWTTDPAPNILPPAS